MARYQNSFTEGDGVVYYEGSVGAPPEDSLSLDSKVMTLEQFRELDKEYQEFILDVSDSFEVTIDDEELKDYASEVLDVRFVKGYNQFCSAARAKNSYGVPHRKLQEDYRLGNADTCAERLVLDEMHREKLEVDNIVTYRGENITNRDGVVHTIKEHGGVSRGRNKGVMRHMVGPCIYCREGMCNHNPATMVILPPATLRPEKTTMKLPAFMLYPDEGVFMEKDPLEEKLKQANNPLILEARRKQREFFKKVVEQCEVSLEDEKLYKEAYDNMQKEPASNDPYYLFRARTVTNQGVEEAGPEPVQTFSYLKYSRNDVSIRFINKLIEQPPFHPDNPERPGRGHSLNVLTALERDPRTNEIKTILPNADTRQKLAENFKLSFIMLKVGEKLIKVPYALLMPEPYKRVDKEDPAGELRP